MDRSHYFTHLRKRLPQYKTREDEYKENTLLSLPNLQELHNQYYGDLFMCQLIFLANISQQTLEEFLTKVKDEVFKDQYVAFPSSKECINAGFSAKKVTKIYYRIFGGTKAGKDRMFHVEHLT